MSRPKELEIETETGEPGEAKPNGTGGKGSEPETAPIDEDVARSVNAALPDVDE